MTTYPPHVTHVLIPALCPAALDRWLSERLGGHGGAPVPPKFRDVPVSPELAAWLEEDRRTAYVKLYAKEGGESPGWTSEDWEQIELGVAS